MKRHRKNRKYKKGSSDLSDEELENLEKKKVDIEKKLNESTVENKHKSSTLG